MIFKMCGFLGLISSVAVQCLAAPVPPASQLLPTNTMAVVTVSDFSQSCQNWERSAWGRFWSDPAMKPFRDKLQARWQSDFVAHIERDLGIRWTNFSGLVGGQFTLAFVPRPGNPASVEPLLLADLGDKAPEFKEKMDALRKSWAAAGRPSATETIRQVEFTRFILPSNEVRRAVERLLPPPKDAASRTNEQELGSLEWRAGVSGALLVVGHSAGILDGVIQRQAGGAEISLARDADFQTLHDKMFREASLYAWVNLRRILERNAESLSDLGKSGLAAGPFSLSARWLDSLGITALRGIAFTFRDDSAGGAAQILIHAPEPRRAGILRVLSFSPKESGPTPFIPADAIKFSRWRLDVAKAWGALESMLADISPQLAGIVKTVVDTAGKDEKNPDFDLRQNLLANMGDDIIAFEKSSKPAASGDSKPAPRLFLIGSARPEQLVSALRALAASLIPPQLARLREREFLGRKVYSVNLVSAPSAPGEKPVEKLIAFAVSGGYVAIANDMALLEDYLRGKPEKPLGGFPGLAGAAARVGGLDTGLFGFENLKETWRNSMETARKESASPEKLFKNLALARQLGLDPGDAERMQDWVDFGLLPPFEQVARYFHILVWSGAMNSDGLSFRFFMPRPPELDK